MKTRTIKQAVVLLSSAMLLAACGGGGGHTPARDASDSKRQSLLYAYPYNDQTEIAAAAPVVLRFTSAVSVTDAESAITLHEGDENDAVVNVEYSNVKDEPRGLLLTPDEHLKPLTDYTVVINNLKLAKGTSANKTLHFTTRPLQKGPKELVVSSDQFEIQRQIPDTNKKTEPVMDFSTFRFQFTQPIDPATAHYGDAPGDTIKLTNADGDLVEATLLIDGPYMTVDPKPEYLKAGEKYTLTIGPELVSTYDEAFGGKTITFTPQDSSPRGEPAILVQKLTQDGTSRLTGKAINQIPVNGTLLGEDANVTQAEGEAVEAELADVTVYPDVTPIRISRGTTLGGSAIEKVLIGGQVDAGFGSGPVSLQFLSDATGYLMPNPYNSERDDALRIVHLFMDVGIATEDPRTNGAFTQDILHIELVGVADVDTQGGHLNIDAVSVVEPDILGQEYGYGLLSFQLQSYADQENPPAQVVVDTTPPSLESWMPGDDKANLQLPGDPIVLNFDGPLDPQSLKQPGALSLTKGGQPLEFQYTLDGASVTIQPDGGLEYSPADDDPQYELELGQQITDIAGNAFVPKTLTFQLPAKVTTRAVPDYSDLDYSDEDIQVNSPVLLSAYPGYPCVTDSSSRDLANGFVGRCAGGPGDWPDPDYTIDAYQPDDNLPLMSLPANQPIVLQFSKEIDPGSVSLGGSFNIVRVNTAGQVVDEAGNPTSTPQTVQGTLAVEGQSITFIPDEPWTDGQIYQYTLGSNGDSDPAAGLPDTYLGSTEAICTGAESICSTDIPPLPLRTQPLGILLRTPITPGTGGGRVVAAYEIKNQYFLPHAGGPSLDMFFKGAKPTRGVLQTLRSMPDVDSNGNFIHDSDASTAPLQTATGITPLFYNTDPTTRYPDPESGLYLSAKYEFQEPGPSVPDPSADPISDPQGVKGLPNSAKILSLNARGTEEPWLLTDTTSGFNLNAALFGADSGNVGCGYKAVINRETGEEQEPPGIFGTVVVDSDPVVCPEKKFTYIKMGLNATVTDEYDPEKGVKVLLWPSQPMSTSFVTHARNPYQGKATMAVPSGDLIMRMRYAKDDPDCSDTSDSPCRRTQPITAWINSDDNGDPQLSADVDLYMDGPLIGVNIDDMSMRHNLHSYQARMSLKGPVTFLDDGRLMIQQRSENAIDIDLQLYLANSKSPGGNDGVAIGRIPYTIPEGGIFLQVVSIPVKSIK